MPEPNVPDLRGAPAQLDQATLDSLFPAEPTPVQVQPVQPPATPNAAAQPQPTQVQTDAPYLKGAKSVYKTAEAATEGINQKDALIEQLRQQYSLATGVDPITKQPLQSTTPQAVDNYVTNPDKYLSDLQGAKSAAQLAQVQNKFIMDSLQPIAPAISAATRSSALNQTKASIPGFENFYGSTEYASTLDQTPSLKEAITAAEADIRYHSRLQDLYKTAYLVHQGIALPELLKKQTPTQTQPQSRPTNTPSMPTAPEATATLSNDLSSKEGRKAIIAQWEQSGLVNKPW